MDYIMLYKTLRCSAEVHYYYSTTLHSSQFAQQLEQLQTYKTSLTLNFTVFPSSLLSAFNKMTCGLKLISFPIVCHTTHPSRLKWL